MPTLNRLTCYHTYQVIGNIAVLAGPASKSGQLLLRLRHVRIEVIRQPQLRPRLLPRIRVCWIEALVMLYVAQHTFFLSYLGETQVVVELLHGRLGHQDVDLASQCILGNGEVGGVRSEDSDGVAGGEGVDGRLVCEGEERLSAHCYLSATLRTSILHSQASASLTPGAG